MTTAGIVAAVNTFGVNGLVSRHEDWDPQSGIDEFSKDTLFLFDERGNTVTYVSGDGTVVIPGSTYDAYGMPTFGGCPPFMFGGQFGQYTDASIGLVLCTYRFYDPNTGRFVNRDPIGYSGGVNQYAYCAGNPVNFADPLGLKFVVQDDSTGYFEDGEQKYHLASMDIYAKFKKALNELSRDPAFKRIIGRLRKSNEFIYIRTETTATGGQFVPGDNYINWSPDKCLAVVDDNGKETGKYLSPALILGHELVHAYRYLFENKDYLASINRSYGMHDAEWRYGNLEEMTVIKQYEVPYAKKFNEGVRTNHDGNWH